MSFFTLLSLNAMIRERLRIAKVGRIAVSALLFASVIAVMSPLTTASAQTQYISATPGYINFGMTTSINVTAPAAGSYTIVVQKPGGSESSLPFTATAAGQVESVVYGNATSGFGTVVNQVGTYNIFLTQGGQTVSSATFYATNKLVVTMDMVTGGTCSYVQGVLRGGKLIPRFYIHYASNDVALTNDTLGVNINFTTPANTVEKANWDGGARLFDNSVLPGWNYTYVGTWTPTVKVSDAAGNFAVYTYSGSPFTIAPAQLATSVQLTDAKTGLPIAAIASGESINIQATVTYPANPEPVSGFVAPLDTAQRGGSVTAVIGWGFWNASADTFGGSAKNPGGVVGTVKLTYTGKNGTWTGQFAGATLPTIPANATYAVAVTSSDSASPPNTGLQVINLAAASAPPGVATTVTSTSVSSLISTTVSTATTTLSQVVQSIPTIVYAGIVIVLILGLVIGMLVRMPRK
jgi:hypothetical protein